MRVRGVVLAFVALVWAGAAWSQPAAGPLVDICSDFSRFEEGRVFGPVFDDGILGFHAVSALDGLVIDAENGRRGLKLNGSLDIGIPDTIQSDTVSIRLFPSAPGLTAVAVDGLGNVVATVSLDVGAATSELVLHGPGIALVRLQGEVAGTVLWTVCARVNLVESGLLAGGGLPLLPRSNTGDASGADRGDAEADVPLAAFEVDPLQAGGAFAAALAPAPAGYPTGTTPAPVSTSCVVFSNLGTVDPHILNSCGRGALATVANYSNTGDLILTREFHLMSGEERSLQFPGFHMRVIAATDWDRGTGEDGFAYADLTHTTLNDGQVLWEVHNRNPSRYIAFRAIIVENGVYHGASTASVPPGGSVRIYAFYFYPGYAYFDWVVLEPL